MEKVKKIEKMKKMSKVISYKDEEKVKMLKNANKPRR